MAHFAQADTIIPGIDNSQAWDRYAYVSNSPLKYSDPSGNIPCDGAYGCFGEQAHHVGRSDKWHYDDSYVPQLEDLNANIPTMQNCMTQITTEDYWANMCGGEGGSNFTHVSMTNPGHEGYSLGVSYDSPTKTGIEVLTNIFTSVYEFPSYRLLWKKITLKATQITSSGLSEQISTIDAWDDTLGSVISNSADQADATNLMIITNVYETDGNIMSVSNETIFKKSDRFVVLVQPGDKPQFTLIYIHTFYQSDFESYFGIR
jgi:hypothetical protein